jgi:hypothetical protein
MSDSSLVRGLSSASDRLRFCPGSVALASYALPVGRVGSAGLGEALPTVSIVDVLEAAPGPAGKGEGGSDKSSSMPAALLSLLGVLPMLSAGCRNFCGDSSNLSVSASESTSRVFCAGGKL